MTSSELIVNKDGSIYHLHLLPEEVAENVILVGDPGRVDLVSSFFDNVEVSKSNREFHTHTGTYKGKRISVISTGIGTDNIDIVLNELDALASLDLKTGISLPEPRKYNFIRIGTSGSLQADLTLNTFLLTRIALGMDGLLHFYNGSKSVRLTELENEVSQAVSWPTSFNRFYAVPASDSLAKMFESERTVSGITISAPGFYGPQGRKLRLNTAYPGLNQKLADFRWKGMRITNYEMESSGLYGLSRMLGHNAITLCAILANRATGKANNDYIPVIKDLIRYVLGQLVA